MTPPANAGTSSGGGSRAGGGKGGGQQGGRAGSGRKQGGGKGGGKQGGRAGSGRKQGGGKGGGRPRPAPEQSRADELAKPLAKVLERIPATQREVLEWRMGLKDGHPHDLSSTAQQLGLSIAETRQIEQRAFEHIREVVPLQQLQKLLGG